MSSSPRLSRNEAPTAPPCEPFPYDTLMDPFGASESEMRIRQDAPMETTVDIAARQAQARRAGYAEGQAEARRGFEEDLAAERSRIADSLAQFASQRATYFRAVEKEVVQLALAIARKILHREAQIDPMLLMGIVRVALEHIGSAAPAVVRVHPQNADPWRKILAAQLPAAAMPEIKEDSAQTPGICTIETGFGSTTIGVEPLLKEIEQGLLDLLAARPGAAS